MADEPIQQDVAQASNSFAGAAPQVADETQATPSGVPVQNANLPIAAPSPQDATVGSPQPNIPGSVTNAGPTAQPSYKESGWHKIAGALAGGTHTATYKVDPETGKIGVELKPKTGREEIMGAVANVLSGLAAGAGQKDFKRGFAAGAQQVSQQLQQQKGQGRQEAIDDYNQQQQAKVQKAQAMHANLQAYSLAQDIGRKDKEDHDTMVSTYADSVKDLRELNIPGADQELSEEDVKKLNGTDKVAMAVGTVPRIDPATGKQAKINGIPQWDNTYIAVPKDARVPVTDEDGKPKDWVTQAQSWGVLPDKKVSPQDLRVGTAASVMHSVAALNSFSTELNNFATKMKVEPTDLKAALKADPALKGALQKFQLTAGMSTQPDIQIDALRQKDPQAAAKIANLFGPDNLEKYKNQRISEAAGEKTAAEEKARLDAKAKDPLEQQKLVNEKLTGQKNVLEIQKLQKDLSGFDLSKISTSSIDPVANPDGTKAGVAYQPDPNYRVNQNVLSQMAQQDSGLAATIQAIGEGREIMTPQAQRTKDGQNILKAVNLAYPDYNAAKVQAYFKGRETGTSGTLGNKTNSFATALDHLQRYYDHLGVLSSTAGVSGLASALGIGDAKKLQTDRAALASELASAYKGGGGSGTEKEADHWDKVLGGPTIWSQREGATETAELLGGKFHEFSNQYRNMIPGGLRDDNLQLMSDQAAQAYKHVTGKEIGNIKPLTQNQPQNAPQARPVIVNGQVVGHTTDGKTMTPVSQ